MEEALPNHRARALLPRIGNCGAESGSAGKPKEQYLIEVGIYRKFMEKYIHREIFNRRAFGYTSGDVRVEGREQTLRRNFPSARHSIRMRDEQ